VVVPLSVLELPSFEILVPLRGKNQGSEGAG
jgi:hypothetical protein